MVEIEKVQVELTGGELGGEEKRLGFVNTDTDSKECLIPQEALLGLKLSEGPCNEVQKDEYKQTSNVVDEKAQCSEKTARTTKAAPPPSIDHKLFNTPPRVQLQSALQPGSLNDSPTKVIDFAYRVNVAHAQLAPTRDKNGNWIPPHDVNRELGEPSRKSSPISRSGLDGNESGASNSTIGSDTILNTQSQRPPNGIAITSLVAADSSIALPNWDPRATDEFNNILSFYQSLPEQEPSIIPIQNVEEEKVRDDDSTTSLLLGPNVRMECFFEGASVGSAKPNFPVYNFFNGTMKIGLSRDEAIAHYSKVLKFILANYGGVTRRKQRGCSMAMTLILFVMCEMFRWLIYYCIDSRIEYQYVGTARFYHGTLPHTDVRSNHVIWTILRLSNALAVIGFSLYVVVISQLAREYFRDFIPVAMFKAVAFFGNLSKVNRDKEEVHQQDCEKRGHWLSERDQFGKGWQAEWAERAQKVTWLIYLIYGAVPAASLATKLGWMLLEKSVEKCTFHVGH